MSGIIRRFYTILGILTIGVIKARLVHFHLVPVAFDETQSLMEKRR